MYEVLAQSDPITAIFQRDWAALGGWSLFVSLALYNVVGFFREWIVPGARAKRHEETILSQTSTIATLSSALEKQVTANEIVKHFFEETTPKRKGTET